MFMRVVVLTVQCPRDQRLLCGGLWAHHFLYVDAKKLGILRGISMAGCRPALGVSMLVISHAAVL